MCVCVQTLLDSMKSSVADGVPIAYHAAYYVNGTLCDITGKPRMTSARVRLHTFAHRIH